jgi:hypothetical protein
MPRRVREQPQRPPGGEILDPAEREHGQRDEDD